ncbi:MAG: hypothetical protein ABEK84_09810 [Salinibacter sp.]
MTTSHLHLMLNHIPLFAMLFGAGVLLYGVLRRQDLASRIGLILFVVAALGAGGTYLTGEGAEEAVEGQPGVTETAMEAHEEVAFYALIVSIVLGLLALGVLTVYWGRSIPRIVSSLTLVVALVAAGTVGYTANTGGKISHPELRTATAMTQQSPEAEEAGGETEREDGGEVEEEEE